MKWDDALRTGGPALPRWPFVLGDILLVLTAGAITALNGWQLDGIQVIACVLAVALGAVLLVLPMIIEQQTSARAASDVVRANQRELQVQVIRLSEHVTSIEDRLAHLHTKIENGETGGAAVDLLAQRLDKLAGAVLELETAQQGEGETLAQLRAAVVRLDAHNEEGEPDAWETPLADLGSRVKALSERLIELEAVLAKAPGDRVRTVRKQRSATRPTLLRRALRHGDQQSDSPQVKRIIREEPNTTRPRMAKKTAPAEPHPSAEAVQPAPVHSPRAHPTTDAPSAQSGAAPADPEPAATPPEAAAESGATADLFAIEEAPPTRTKRVRKNDTAVIANVLIGIGNKPYLRGEGGGLSWDKGVLMDFEAIGKWRWVAPEASGEIEFQIYKNDEEPDPAGRHRLTAGSQIVVAPEFK